jgi:DNA-binding MarR family transcriptional regulator
VTVPPTRPSGVAFLLSQLGAHTAARFAARLAELDLTPSQVGVLRVVGQTPGISQRQVATSLGAVPSRVVKLVDELEAKGLIERRPSTADRRAHELHVTGGPQQMAQILAVVSANDVELIAALSHEEVATLLVLLGKVAAGAGLGPSAHPGYGR